MGNCCCCCCCDKDDPFLRGVIYNASHFPIYYQVYDLFIQQGTILQQPKTQPKAGVQGAIAKIKAGLVSKSDEKIKYFANNSILVQPGRACTFGLEQITSQKQKFSLAVAIKDQYIMLVVDNIIKTSQEICLKIGTDLSIEQFTKEQAVQLRNFALSSSITVDQTRMQKGRWPKIKTMEPYEIANIQKVLVEANIGKIKQLVEYVHQENSRWINNYSQSYYPKASQTSYGRSKKMASSYYQIEDTQVRISIQTQAQSQFKFILVSLQNRLKLYFTYKLCLFNYF